MDEDAIPNDVRRIVERLSLIPHPEGGHYRQTWSAPTEAGGRPPGTAIYYLLGPDERSAWHRIDSTEIWHYYAGGPIELTLATTDQGPVTCHLLGQDIAAGHEPQVVIPPGTWQTARPIDGYTLVGCTVSPGFEYSGWELAPEGWEPNAQPPSASK